MENPATWNEIIKLLNNEGDYGRAFKSAEEVFELLNKHGHWKHFYADLIDQDLKLIEKELHLDDPEDPRHFASFGARIYWILKEVGAVE